MSQLKIVDSSGIWTRTFEIQKVAGSIPVWGSESFSVYRAWRSFISLNLLTNAVRLVFTVTKVHIWDGSQAEFQVFCRDDWYMVFDSALFQVQIPLWLDLGEMGIRTSHFSQTWFKTFPEIWRKHVYLIKNPVLVDRHSLKGFIENIYIVSIWKKLKRTFRSSLTKAIVTWPKRPF